MLSVNSDSCILLFKTIKPMKNPFFSLLFLLGLFITLITYTYFTVKTGTLTDVGFMEGHWQGTFNGGPIEAAWIAPVGDNLTGCMRMMNDNKVTMYELLIFEQTQQGDYDDEVDCSNIRPLMYI